MPKLRVDAFSISIDGYGAGPNQCKDHPLGENGMELHEWFFETLTFRKMQGQEGGRDGLDESFAARAMQDEQSDQRGEHLVNRLRLALLFDGETSTQELPVVADQVHVGEDVGHDAQREHGPGLPVMESSRGGEEH